MGRKGREKTAQPFYFSLLLRGITSPWSHSLHPKSSQPVGTQPRLIETCLRWARSDRMHNPHRSLSSHEYKDRPQDQSNHQFTIVSQNHRSMF